MAARSSLFGNRHDSILRAGNGAANEEQIPLGVHPNHPEANLGVARGAHVSWHPLALDDPGGVSARADRARLAVPSIAVGGRPAAEAMAMDHALESSALRGAGDLDQLPGREDVHLQFGTRGRSLSLERKAPEHLGSCFEPGLLGVAQLRLRGALRATCPEPELDVTIPDLHHPAGAGLDDRHRYRAAVFI